MTGTKITFVVLAALALTLSGCREPAPVLAIESMPYHSVAPEDGGPALSLSQFEGAIIRAGSTRGWTFSRQNAGHLEGRLLVRGKHTAIVDVYFDRETFSILHKDSINLEYNPVAETIHPNYNSWVRNLEQDIQAEVQRMRFT